MIEVKLSTKEKIKDGLGGYEENIVNNNNTYIGNLIFDNTKEINDINYYIYTLILNKKYNNYINCRELGDIVIVDDREYELIKAIDFGDVYILTIKSLEYA